MDLLLTGLVVLVILAVLFVTRNGGIRHMDRSDTEDTSKSEKGDESWTLDNAEEPSEESGNE